MTSWSVGVTFSVWKTRRAWRIHSASRPTGTMNVCCSVFRRTPKRLAHSLAFTLPSMKNV
jgi:hypothetical protein